MWPSHIVANYAVMKNLRPSSCADRLCAEPIVPGTKKAAGQCVQCGSWGTVCVRAGNEQQVGPGVVAWRVTTLRPSRAFLTESATVISECFLKSCAERVIEHSSSLMRVFGALVTLWKYSCWPVCAVSILRNWEPGMEKSGPGVGRCMHRVLKFDQSPFPRAPDVWRVVVAGRGEAGKERRGVGRLGTSSGYAEC